MSKRADRSRGRPPTQRSRSSPPVDSARRPAFPLRAVAGVVVLALIVAVMVLVVSHQGRGAPRSSAERVRVQHQVAALFAGIPQRGTILGQPTAPVTLQVFVDLEDHGNGVQWFDEMLPPILATFVRTDVVRLEFHSLKTDTLNRVPFVMQQTAALAAGAQNRLWNYADTFINEQGTEFTNYVNEAFVTGIGEQVPGLNLVEWERSRTAKREYIVQEDSYTARHRLGLYVTPSFRIGLTGGKMDHLSAGIVYHYHKYIVHTTPSGERYIAGVSSSEWQHPVWANKERISLRRSAGCGSASQKRAKSSRRACARSRSGSVGGLVRCSSSSIIWRRMTYWDLVMSPMTYSSRSRSSWEVSSRRRSVSSPRCPGLRTRSPK